jgi:hypothetical protein
MALHELVAVPTDPTDQGLPVKQRLIAARATLTRLVRAADQAEADLRYRVRQQLDLRLAPEAPHRLWLANLPSTDDMWDPDNRFASGIPGPAGEAAQRGSQGAVEADDSWDEPAPDLIGRSDPRSGKMVRFHPRGWPPRTTYGDEDWYVLRWRPRWYLDDGQRWMDRFELGEAWWEAIYRDPRFDTEPKFDKWRHDHANGCRGVIWSAPTPTGRLDAPDEARVVVSSTRSPRRTAIWPLVRSPDPTSMTPTISKATPGADATVVLARSLFESRVEARRRRRS